MFTAFFCSNLHSPWQHSAQKLSCICGTFSQDMMPPSCLDGSRKTSLVTLSMASPLLHRTAAKDVCLICVSCAGENTAGSSYQNLKTLFEKCH